MKTKEKDIEKRNEVGERDGWQQLFDFGEDPNAEAFIPMVHLHLLSRLEEAEELLAA